MLMVVPIVAGLVGVVTAGPAQAVTSTSYNLTTGGLTAPHLYRVSVFSTQSGVDVILKRTTTKGTQSHTWGFFDPGVLSCVSTLNTCTLNTKTNMDGSGSGGKDYGAIDMTFHPSKPAKTVSIKCSNGTVTGSVTTRVGHLTGGNSTNPGFDFMSNTSFFGELKHTSFPVKVTKDVSNGKTCPPPKPVCYQSLGGYGSYSPASGPSLNFSGYRPLPKGSATIYFSVSESYADTTPAIVSDSINSKPVAASSVSETTTLTKLKINGTAVTPLLTGTATITRVGSLTSSHPTTHCTDKYGSGNVTGNLTAHFDVIGDFVAQGTGSLYKDVKT
jgi:hypothetical protein